MNNIDTHEKYMKTALSLAVKGVGKVNPNPLVGAVIIKDNKIIGEGYHTAFGSPHAEIEAIKSCNQDLYGSTLYVTLEPCCHFGKTPPCTDAIIKNKISTVVIGSDDPNVLVSGNGIKKLHENGINVITGILKAECDKINEIFFHYIKTKTPFVIMKYAMTADGKIATRSGASQWITGEAARTSTHFTRNSVSGIMAGIGTVLSDDPLLTCRIPDGKNPIRIICDSSLSIPLTSKIVQTAKDIPTIVASVCYDEIKKKELELMGVTVLKIESKNKYIDLKKLMIKLGEREIDSIILEGGGNLNYSALQEGIINRVQLYIGAKIFGGKDSLTPVEGEGIEKIADAKMLKLINTQIFDNDILLEYNLEHN